MSIQSQRRLGMEKYYEAKEEGICCRCRNMPVGFGKTACTSCRVKQRNYYQNVITI